MPVPAAAGKALLGLLMDVCVAAAAVLVAVEIAYRLGAPTVAVAVTASLLALAIWLHLALEHGQALGWSLLRVRMVSKVDQSPLGWARLPSLTRAWFADLRRGRDPVDLSVVADLAPRRPPQAPDPLATHQGVGRPVVGLIPAGAFMSVNGKARYPLRSPLLVGRNPTAWPGQVAVAITDLSRELSRTHFLVEYHESGRVMLTDLNSGNGTWVEDHSTPEGRTRLPANVPIAVSSQTVVRVGEYRFTFELPMPQHLLWPATTGSAHG